MSIIPNMKKFVQQFPMSSFGESNKKLLQDVLYDVEKSSVTPFTKDEDSYDESTEYFINPDDYSLLVDDQHDFLRELSGYINMEIVSPLGSHTFSDMKAAREKDMLDHSRTKLWENYPIELIAFVLGANIALPISNGNIDADRIKRNALFKRIKETCDLLYPANQGCLVPILTNRYQCAFEPSDLEKSRIPRYLSETLEELLDQYKDLDDDLGEELLLKLLSLCYHLRYLHEGKCATDNAFIIGLSHNVYFYNRLYSWAGLIHDANEYWSIISNGLFDWESCKLNETPYTIDVFPLYHYFKECEPLHELAKDVYDKYLSLLREYLEDVQEFCNYALKLPEHPFVLGISDTLLIKYEVAPLALKRFKALTAMYCVHVLSHFLVAIAGKNVPRYLINIMAFGPEVGEWTSTLQSISTALSNDLDRFAWHFSPDDFKFLFVPFKLQAQINQEWLRLESLMAEHHPDLKEAMDDRRYLLYKEAIKGKNYYFDPKMSRADHFRRHLTEEIPVEQLAFIRAFEVFRFGYKMGLATTHIVPMHYDFYADQVGEFDYINRLHQEYLQSSNVIDSYQLIDGGAKFDHQPARVCLYTVKATDLYTDRFAVPEFKHELIEVNEPLSFDAQCSKFTYGDLVFSIKDNNTLPKESLGKGFLTFNPSVSNKRSFLCLVHPDVLSQCQNELKNVKINPAALTEGQQELLENNVLLRTIVQRELPFKYQGLYSLKDTNFAAKNWIFNSNMTTFKIKQSTIVDEVAEFKVRFDPYVSSICVLRKELLGGVVVLPVYFTENFSLMLEGLDELRGISRDYCKTWTRSLGKLVASYTCLQPGWKITSYNEDKSILYFRDLQFKVLETECFSRSDSIMGVDANTGEYVISISPLVRDSAYFTEQLQVGLAAVDSSLRIQRYGFLHDRTKAQLDKLGKLVKQLKSASSNKGSNIKAESSELKSVLLSYETAVNQFKHISDAYDKVVETCFVVPDDLTVREKGKGRDFENEAVSVGLQLVIDRIEQLYEQLVQGETLVQQLLQKAKAQ